MFNRRSNMAVLASSQSVFAAFSQALALDRFIATETKPGPGKKSIHGLHARSGRSKYMPHQGQSECARRVRQMQLQGEGK